jgi:hypothetical protein
VSRSIMEALGYDVHADMRSYLVIERGNQHYAHVSHIGNFINWYTHDIVHYDTLEGVIDAFVKRFMADNAEAIATLPDDVLDSGK